MSQRHLQTSFAGGEFSPTMWGRFDLAQFRTGCRTLKNFFVTPHGAAANRPGTAWLATLPSEARIVPFVFTDDAAILLCFLHNKIRFYWVAPWGAVVLVVSGGSAVEVVTTYTAAELPALRMAQMGNVITIVHKNHAPAELRYHTSSIWTFGNISFGASAFPTARGMTPRLDQSKISVALANEKRWKYCITRVLEWSDGRVEETRQSDVTAMSICSLSFWSGAVTYAAGDCIKIMDGATTRYYSSRVDTNLNHDPLTASAWWTEVLYNSYLTQPDSLFVSSTLPTDGFCVAQDKPQTIFWHPFGDQPAPGATYSIIKTRIYRGTNERYGYLGEVGPTENYFTDTGEEPDYHIAPPTGRNPFSGAGKYPSQVCYFEGRRVFAGPDDYPSRISASATEIYTDFDLADLPLDDDAVEFDIASKRLERVKALIPRDRLLVMTSDSEWTVSGSGQSEIITPSAVSAHQTTEHGCSDLEPLVVQGSTILFLQRKSGIPRALVFSSEAGGYQSFDVSLFSRHLFTGHSIVSWCYAEDPWATVWAVRDDGVLLSLAYVREQGMVAWAWHQMAESGLVECVVSVPDPSGSHEDLVFLIVNRAGVRTLERLCTRVVDDCVEAQFLDCSVTYDMRGVVGGAITAMTGLSHLNGKSVYAVADGVVCGPFVVAAGQITLDEAAYRITAGLRYDCDFESLDIPQADGLQKMVKAAWLGFEGSRGGYVGQSLSGPLTEWRQRAVSHGYDAIPLENGKVKVPISAQWSTYGRIAVRQADPLPLTILGITRLWEPGGE